MEDAQFPSQPYALIQLHETSDTVYPSSCVTPLGHGCRRKATRNDDGRKGGHRWCHTRAFTVKRSDGRTDEGTEVIGWDPSIGKIRSWIFEADGGFSENVWTQDGPRWLVQARTVLPDGGQATAQHTVTKIDNDKFTWSSANRELDGELLPNIEAVTIVRSK